MLRRLFISLIILSTLTAEGLVNVPWNIYNLCLCVNNGSILPGNISNNTESYGKMQPNKSSFSGSDLRGKLFAGSNSLDRIRYSVDIKNLSKYSFTGLNPSGFCTNLGSTLSCDFSKAIFYDNLGQDKKVIIKKSDSSPPLYNL